MNMEKPNEDTVKLETETQAVPIGDPELEKIIDSAKKENMDERVVIFKQFGNRVLYRKGVSGVKYEFVDSNPEEKIAYVRVVSDNKREGGMVDKIPLEELQDFTETPQ